MMKDKVDGEETLEQVRVLLTQAAALVRSISPGYERIGWLIEDVLTYLDEAGESASLPPLDEACLDPDPLPKAVNLDPA